MTESTSKDVAIRDLLAVAQEQLRWFRAANLPAVKNSLLGALTTTDMRRVYELCDGNRTFRDLATAAGVALGTVGSWTRRWRDAGLAYETEGGRVAQLVSLEAVGISIEVDTPTQVPKSKTPTKR